MSSIKFYFFIFPQMCLSLCVIKFRNDDLADLELFYDKASKYRVPLNWEHPSHWGISHAVPVQTHSKYAAGLRIPVSEKW